MTARAKIDAIKKQLSELVALSDADIQQLVDGGADAGALLAAEAEKENQRRALQFQLNSLEKKAAESDRVAARKELDAVLMQQEAAKAQAQDAVNRVYLAAETVAAAIADFQVAAGDYAELAGDAHSLSRRAGVAPQEQTRLHPELATFERKIIAALSPYRRAKVFDEVSISEANQ